MQKCFYSPKVERNYRARVILGFLSNEFLISKPKLLKISVSPNTAASTSPFLWLTKFLSHLHKNHSQLFGSSCTTEISVLWRGGWSWKFLALSFQQRLLSLELHPQPESKQHLAPPLQKRCQAERKYWLLKSCQVGFDQPHKTDAKAVYSLSFPAGGLCLRLLRC